MSLRTRIYIDTHLANEINITLSESNFHYLANVLRVKPEEKIRIFNGIDGEWEASIQHIGKKELSIQLLKKLRDQEQSSSLHLAFAPVKHVNTSFIIEKATELGVTHIHPIIMKRSVVDKVNLEKLHLAAIEAAQQSERLYIPKICNIISINQFLQSRSFNGKLIFAYEKSPHILSTLDFNENCIDDCLLIGPEGGISEDEYNQLKLQDNSLEIGLGKGILRSETAIIALVSAYNTLMKRW
jgi:16S rRNA (uracil1498-N3)-methyltransferase